MLPYNLMPSEIDSDGNQKHDVLDTRTGEDMFRVMKELIAEEKEKHGVARLNWRHVFNRVLFNYFYELEEYQGYRGFLDILTHEEEKRFEDIFLREMNTIAMRDTLYADVEDGMKHVVDSAGEVDIWTAGDNVNEHQLAKLVSSEIFIMIHDAVGEVNLPTRTNDVIDDEKSSKIPVLLDAMAAHTGSNKLLITVYDDKARALKAAQEDIELWKLRKKAEGKEVEVAPILVRAKRGRHGREEWDKTDAPEHESVDTLHQLAAVIENQGSQLGIPRKHRIALLDFDGALSDNRLLRLRQTHVMYTNMMKALRLAVWKYLQIKEKRRVKSRKEMNALIRANRDLVWDIYNSVVRPPNHFLNRIIGEIAVQTGKTLDQDCIESLYEIDNCLQTMDFNNPKFTADDVRAEFLKLSGEMRENSDFYKLSRQYDGQNAFLDKEFYESLKKFAPAKEEDPQILMMFSDTERERINRLAESFEQQSIYKRIAPDYIENLRFRSGGLKKRTSIVNKIVRNTLAGQADPLDRIHDLARGTLTVDSSGFESAYTEMESVLGHLLCSTVKRDMVAFQNYFLEPYNKGDDGGPGNPIQGFKVVFKLDDQAVYELQIHTRRGDAVGRLNHDTFFKEFVDLSPAQKDYVLKLSWAAHIMDMEEHRCFVEQERAETARMDELMVGQQEEDDYEMEKEREEAEKRAEEEFYVRSGDFYGDEGWDDEDNSGWLSY